jgi:hypothetical protein
VLVGRIAWDERSEEGPDFVIPPGPRHLSPIDVLPDIEGGATTAGKKKALVESDSISRVVVGMVEEARPDALRETDRGAVRVRHRERPDDALLNDPNKSIKGTKRCYLGRCARRHLASCAMRRYVLREVDDIVREVRAGHVRLFSAPFSSPLC